MSRPYLLVFLVGDEIPPLLETAIRRCGATAGYWPLDDAVAYGDPGPADAFVVLAPEALPVRAAALSRLLLRLALHGRATLLLGRSAQELQVLAPPALPTLVGHEHDADALTHQLGALLAMRPALDEMRRTAVHSRRRGDRISRRYSRQLRLASRVQRQFIPETLPRVTGVQCDVVFEPVDFVSGDIYDVHELDDEHIGFALADATGHGLPAALFTVYIKRALRGREHERGAYRVLAPDEVLARLNADVLDAELAECPFVAAIYAVYNHRTRVLRIARGGAPYPLLRTPDGVVRTIRAEGGVLGVVPGAEFNTVTMQLEAGASVVLHSDGVQRVAAPDRAYVDAPETLRAAARRVAHWAGASTAPSPTSASNFEPDIDQPGPASTALAEPEAERAAPCIHTLEATLDDWHDPEGDLSNSAWRRVLEEDGAAAALLDLRVRRRRLARIGFPLDDVTALAFTVTA